MFTCQFNYDDPTVRDDGVFRRVADEVPPLEQCGDSATVGRAGLQVVGTELRHAGHVVKAVAVIITQHPSVALHYLAHQPSHLGCPARKIVSDEH